MKRGIVHHMDTYTLLKDIFHTIRNDYAGFEEVKARHNPSPALTMLAEAHYNHKMPPTMPLQAVSQYLSNLRDRNLKFTMNSDENYQPFSRGFYVRRCDEGLFVDEVTSEIRLQVGDKVLTINGQTPERIVSTLPNPLLASDIPEREQWTGYLKLADHMIVEHVDGTQEDIVFQKYPLDLPNEPQFEKRENTVILKFSKFETCEDTEKFLQAHQKDIEQCKRLIIDLRKNIGGSEEGYLPLLGYIVKEDSTLNDVYGNRTIWTNYSETNCQRSIDNLQPYLESDVKEIKEYVQSAISYYEQMKAVGWIKGEQELFADPETCIKKMGPEYVAILIDTWCENEAEQFVRIAKEQGRSKLIGRPTMGNIDYLNPIKVRYENYEFSYPISKTDAAKNGNGVNDKGIEPDQYIPFKSLELMEETFL